MAKLSTRTALVTGSVTKNPKSRVRTKSSSPDALTYNGAPGYEFKPKSELYMLAVSNMVSEDTYYESGADRDQRYAALIHKVTREDPDWIARFVPYLRNSMNMRSASIVMACEYVRAGGPRGRAVIDSAIQRADEPSEVLGYWRSQYGRQIPQPVKRGVADAVRRLYTEKNLIKYDADNGGYRPADVIDIVHPSPKAPWQSALFGYALSKRHGRPDISTDGLPVITAYNALMALPVSERRALILSPSGPERLSEAGMTWESLAGWLQGPMDAKAWEAIIPQMGYMALLRNLRNFEQAQIDPASRAKVLGTLTDPEAVAKSRQFPYRFLSAFENVESLDFKAALETALSLSVRNIPALKGRTLILVDSSGSMMGTSMSSKSKMTYAKAAAVFGGALAKSAEHVDIHLFADRADKAITTTRATPILSIIDEMVKRNGVVGYGTNTHIALNQTFAGHDRVIIVSDMQTSGHVKTLPGVRYYTFQLGGYRVSHTQAGKDGVYVFGGLSDAAFSMLDLIERGEDQDWPF